MSFEAGLLQESDSFSKCAKAKIIGFGADLKDVLIICIFRDQVVE